MTCKTFKHNYSCKFYIPRNIYKYWDILMIFVPIKRKVVQSVLVKFFFLKDRCIEGILLQAPQLFELLWSRYKVDGGHNYWDISPIGHISVYKSSNSHYKAMFKLRCSKSVNLGLYFSLCKITLLELYGEL